MNFLAFSIFIAIIAFTAYNSVNLPHLAKLLVRRVTQLAATRIGPQVTLKSAMSTTQPSSSFKGLPVIPPNDPSLNSKNPISRQIAKVFEAIEQAEGAGARVRRSIGTGQLRNFTPFLMLDHFSIPPGAGFPDHPHRGQETITYLLSGSVDHEDFTGHKGVINEGDLQFMTAGKGIVHAEMPHQNSDGSPNIGMQLWVDLPSDLKDCEPRYRDLRKEEISTATSADGKVVVKVISGQSLGVDSLQELAYTPVWFLDVTIKPGGDLEQGIPAKWNAFLYTLSGTVTIGKGGNAGTIKQYHNVVLASEGDALHAHVDAEATEGARFILIAGLPLEQEIIQYGPFVVSKPEDIRKAMRDYQTYSNGFERAFGWESEIGKNMVR